MNTPRFASASLLAAALAMPLAAQCAPSLPEGLLSAFQPNQPSATLRANGSTNEIGICATFPVSIEFASTVAGAAWDVGATFNAGLWPGRFTSPGGQQIDLDFLHPSFLLLLGGAFNVPFVGVTAPWVPPFLGASTTSVEAQMVVFDPAHPDGYALSAALRLSRVLPAFPPAVVPGPAGNDSSVAIVGGTPPLCAGFSFYGTSYSVLHVTSNGRVMAPPVSLSPSPTLAEAMTGSPFVGAWMDLDPSAGGSIGITLLDWNVIWVRYDAVRIAGSAATATFSILHYGSTGQWTIMGLNGIPAGSSPEFLGISRGAGATDDGMASFAASAGFGYPTSATSMIYRLGPQGTLTTAPVTGVAFSTSASFAPNYVWMVM